MSLEGIDSLEFESYVPNRSSLIELEKVPWLIDENKIMAKGGMGAIYEIHGQENRVAKKLDLRTSNSMDYKYIFQHENIVESYGLAKRKQDEKIVQIFVILEKIEGKNLYEEEEAWEWNETSFQRLKEMASAIAHLHKQDIAHGDIKPNNFMLDKRNNRIKLIDFGMARSIHEKEEERKFPGTVFMSPEEMISFPSDIYSLGLTYLFLFTREIPPSSQEEENYQKWLENTENLIQDRVPECFQHLLKKMLQEAPENRFSQGEELLKEMEKAEIDSFFLPTLIKKYGIMPVIGNREVSLDPSEKHYQILPLLKKVEKKELPQDQTPDKRNELPEWRIQQWEEAMLRRQEEVEEITLEAALEKQTCCIILGQPGSGKSTLLRYLVWQTAQKKLKIANKYFIPASISLKDWESTEQNLVSYLLSAYSFHAHAPSKKQWEDLLKSGEVLLLLDGLDEIGNEFYRKLKTWIEPYSACPLVYTCRTVSFDQYKDLGEIQVFTLSPFSQSARNQYIQAYKSLTQSQYDPEKLIQEIDRASGMAILAANPLLLSIICYVVEDGQVELPATRARFYDTVLVKMLSEQRQRKSISYPPGICLGNSNTQVVKKSLLSCAALFLFLQENRKLFFSDKELHDALIYALKECDFTNSMPDTAIAFKKDLLQAGIIRGNERGYFFLHLTLQEYLVASALAECVTRHGWETPCLSISGNKISARHLISRKAWDPAWLEVIKLMAGNLENPCPLLELFLNPKPTQENPWGDDMFRHRLSVSALCLPEIDIEKLNNDKNIKKLAERITKEYVQLVFYGDDIHRYIIEDRKILPALAQINALVQPSKNKPALPFLSYIASLIEIRDSIVLSCILLPFRILKGLMWVQAKGEWDVFKLAWENKPSRIRYYALEALEKMGEKAATPELLQFFRLALQDKNPDVRTSALEALGQMGEKAATPEVLHALVFALQDECISAIAAEVLGKMGEKTAIPEVLHALLLSSNDKYFKYSFKLDLAREVLGKIGEKPALPDVLHTLLLASNDKDNVKCYVARVLEKMGEKAATPEFLHTLILALQYKDVTYYATKVLEKMGEKEATPEVLQALLLALQDQNAQYYAAKVLEKMGEKAATPDVLHALLLALQDQNAQSYAAEVLGKMGEKAATPDVLHALVLALQAQNWHTGYLAAEALGKMGEKAATPDVLHALVLALQAQPWYNTGYVAAEALGKMGEKAATPEIIQTLLLLSETGDDILLKSLKNNYIYARYMLEKATTPDVFQKILMFLKHKRFSVVIDALDVLAGMGEKAFTPDALRSILRCLKHKDSYVVSKALDVLKEMGEKAATPDVLISISRCLKHKDSDVVSKALDVLLEMGEKAFTPEVLRSILRCLKHKDSDVVSKALDVLKEMGEKAATPDVLQKPLQILFHKPKFVPFSPGLIPLFLILWVLLARKVIPMPPEPMISIIADSLCILLCSFFLWVIFYHRTFMPFLIIFCWALFSQEFVPLSLFFLWLVLSFFIVPDPKLFVPGDAICHIIQSGIRIFEKNYKIEIHSIQDLSQISPLDT